MKAKGFIKDYISAWRKAGREESLKNSTGFEQLHKLQQSKKTYTRKMKHKKGGAMT